MLDKNRYTAAVYLIAQIGKNFAKFHKTHN